MFPFKKKLEKEGLKKALDLELITKKEFLELNYKRAENELENYTKIKIKVKTKRK